MSATRYDTYSDRTAPVKVVMANCNDRAMVLSNKQKLADYKDMEKVRIEKFLTKSDALARDNWSTILNALGEAGKHLRVAGTGRIVKKPVKKDPGSTSSGRETVRRTAANRENRSGRAANITLGPGRSPYPNVRVAAGKNHTRRSVAQRYKVELLMWTNPAGGKYPLRAK